MKWNELNEWKFNNTLYSLYKNDHFFYFIFVLNFTPSPMKNHQLMCVQCTCWQVSERIIKIKDINTQRYVIFLLLHFGIRFISFRLFLFYFVTTQKVKKRNARIKKCKIKIVMRIRFVCNSIFVFTISNVFALFHSFCFLSLFTRSKFSSFSRFLFFVSSFH